MFFLCVFSFSALARLVLDGHIAFCLSASGPAHESQGEQRTAAGLSWPPAHRCSQLSAAQSLLPQLPAALQACRPTLLLLGSYVTASRTNLHITLL